jgi:predicted metal-dependent hydrolase
MTAAVVVLDGMTVPVKTGGNSRRATLTIERDGSLRLRAAEDVDRVELETFLASKRDWIYQKLAEKEVLRYEPITKELVDGEGFLYIGRSHRLRIAPGDAGRVRLEGGRLLLPEALRAKGHAAIIGWYQRRGCEWLRPRVQQWAQRLRVQPGALEVADLGYKWGTATPGGRIRIHWAVMQLSPGLIDYVLAHELAHLREPHHGPTFWELLGRAVPDYEERKAQLARIGAGLWFGEAHL